MDEGKRWVSVSCSLVSFTDDETKRSCSRNSLEVLVCSSLSSVFVSSAGVSTFRHDISPFVSQEAEDDDRLN